MVAGRQGLGFNYPAAQHSERIDMSQETISCPKCSHQQTNQVECEACGLLFRRFEQVRERERQTKNPPAAPDGPVESAEPAVERSSGSFLKLSTILVLVAATAATTYWFAAGNKQPADAPLAMQQASPATDMLPIEPQSRTAPPPGPRSEQKPVGNTIEQAKLGTVAIETPWGTVGSGFFLTPNLVVTNRHVVEQDNSNLDELRHKVQTARQMITLEQEQIAQIRGWLKTMPEGPARRQLILSLQEKERAVAKAIPMQEEAERRLQQSEEPGRATDIKIFLADGSEHNPQSIQVSSKRDLALLTVYGGSPRPLKAATRSMALKEGDKVYTVGNPSGLRHTVTAGIFSGYRQNRDTGEVVLQTDAPINPGNSGGPLIDEQGRVHGVNYMIYRNTQGIGFAIPIQAVFEDFSITQ